MPRKVRKITHAYPYYYYYYFIIIIITIIIIIIIIVIIIIVIIIIIIIIIILVTAKLLRTWSVHQYQTDAVGCTPKINPGHGMSELIGSLDKIKESGLSILQVVFPNKTSFIYLLGKPL